MYKLVKPLLFKLDPEKAHGLTIDALKMVQRVPKIYPIMDKIFNYNHHHSLKPFMASNLIIPLVSLQDSINLVKYLKH